MQVSFDPGMMQKQGMEVSEVSLIKNVYTNAAINVMLHLPQVGAGGGWVGI